MNASDLTTVQVRVLRTLLAGGRIDCEPQSLSYFLNTPGPAEPERLQRRTVDTLVRGGLLRPQRGRRERDIFAVVERRCTEFGLSAASATELAAAASA